MVQAAKSYNGQARRPVKRATAAVATKTPRRVTAAKASTRRAPAREKKSPTEGLKAIKTALKATEYVDAIVAELSTDEVEFPKRDVKDVLNTYFNLVKRQMMPKGAGEAKIGNLVKIVVVHKAARVSPAKKATDINPFTGEAFGEAKPARKIPAKTVAKVRPLGELKLTVTGA